jgi:hypothetical protein
MLWPPGVMNKHILLLNMIDTSDHLEVIVRYEIIDKSHIICSSNDLITK